MIARGTRTVRDCRNHADGHIRIDLDCRDSAPGRAPCERAIGGATGGADDHGAASSSEARRWRRARRAWWPSGVATTTTMTSRRSRSRLRRRQPPRQRRKRTARGDRGSGARRMGPAAGRHLPAAQDAGRRRHRPGSEGHQQQRDPGSHLQPHASLQGLDERVPVRCGDGDGAAGQRHDHLPAALGHDVPPRRQRRDGGGRGEHVEPLPRAAGGPGFAGERGELGFHGHDHGCRRVDGPGGPEGARGIGAGADGLDGLRHRLEGAAGPAGERERPGAGRGRGSVRHRAARQRGRRAGAVSGLLRA